MITANFTNGFYREINELVAGSGFSGFADAELDFGIRLDDFGAVFEGFSAINGWAVTSLTAMQIVQTHPAGYTVTVSGSGIGPISSFAALEAAIEAGLANGTLNRMTVRDAAGEFLRIDLSATSYVLQSGQQRITLTGATANSFAALADLQAAFALYNVDDLYAKTPAERAQVFAALSDFGLTGFSVTDGAETLIDLQITGTTATLNLGGYVLTLQGSFPTDFGDVASLTFDAFVALIEDGIDESASLLAGLDLTGMTFRNPEGVVLLSATGPLTSSDPVTLNIDGVNVSDAEIQFDAFGDGSFFFADTFLNPENGRVSNVLLGTFGADNLEGSAGKDRLFGFDGDDILDGGDGNDFLNPGDNAGGYDLVEAGTGNDTISFADVVGGYVEIGTKGLTPGISVVINGLTNTGSINKGTAGTTTLIDVAKPINAGATTGGLGIYGTDSSDTFSITIAPGGYLQIYGSAGADTYTVQPNTGNVRVDFGRFATTGIVASLATGIISNDGQGFADRIFGGGVNGIYGTDFADSITGSNAAGREVFLVGAGNDTVNGNGGLDEVRYSTGFMQGGVTVDLALGTAVGFGNNAAFSQTLIDIDNVRGTNSFDDTLRGTNLANLIQGRRGNDLLEGRGGNDTLEGDAGSDTLNGGDGDDSLVGGGADTALGEEDEIDGGSGNDTIRSDGGDSYLIGGQGNDLIDGGSGYDQVSYQDAAAAVSVNLGAQVATQDGFGTSDILIGIEMVRGSRFGDLLVGDDLDNQFRGLAGNDTINGGGGIDRVRYDGDQNRGGPGAVNVNLALQTATDGFGNTDTLIGIENVRGTEGNDTIRGDGQGNQLEGRFGNDSLFGGAGNDWINPGDNDGTDLVQAGTGNDTIDFSESFSGEQIIDHSDLSVGVVVTINGLTNSGSVNKGVNGTTTILDVANTLTEEATSAGSFTLFGTNFNDVFNITNTPEGFITITGGRGADTYNVQPGTNVRLYFNSGGMPGEGGVSTGIAVNLATGIIANDGHGFADRIFGGGVNDIRATRFTDTITGSAAAYEEYATGLGNDTVNGGGGVDRVRYDRTGLDSSFVGGVNVDLITQSSTGRGLNLGVLQNFTHRLLNIEQIRGTVSGDDTIRGDAAANMFQGRGGNDALDGRGGNDSLFGEDGNDRVRGGGGRDLLDGGANDDRLYGDGLKVAFAADVSAQVFRLYQATLNRAPDTAGHLDWTTRLVEGDNTLSNVAASFVGSREFTNVYGPSLTNTQFVTLLYQNVLNRAPDQSGLDSWLTRMTNGTSRADVVVGFSESGEFKNATRTAGNNFTQSHTDQVWSDDVFRLFQATLNRAPDLAGFMDWTNRLGTGTDFLTAVDGFVGSREFTNIYGASLTNTQFVTLLYNNVLDRAPDQAGLTDWLARMAGGTTRSAVVQGFSQSTEFVNRTAADLTAWMRAQGTDDVLQGGAGNNTLTGGSLSDTFIFDSSLGTSTHRVLDLEVWDTLEFRNFGYVQDSDIRAHLSQVGADVVFADDAVTVTFVGTQLSRITDDMLFA